VGKYNFSMAYQFIRKHDLPLTLALLVIETHLAFLASKEDNISIFANHAVRINLLEQAGFAKLKNLSMDYKFLCSLGSYYIK
jgi:hypothetical protein